jgi:hypothetical protein
LVITAASATHTSFGCANERKWTYFGEAFFKKDLAGSATLAVAFASAKATIAAWKTNKTSFRPSRRSPWAIGSRVASPSLSGPRPPLRPLQLKLDRLAQTADERDRPSRAPLHRLVTASRPPL